MKLMTIVDHNICIDNTIGLVSDTGVFGDKLVKVLLNFNDNTSHNALQGWRK